MTVNSVSDLKKLILAAFLPATVAYSAVLLSGFAPRQFATLSNLSCVSVACFLKTAHVSSPQNVQKKPVVGGFLDDGPFVLAFLGAASFAFHLRELTDTRQHTLDVVFGLVVAMHCAFVSISTLIFFASQCSLLSVSIALNCTWLTILVLLLAEFEYVYTNFKLFDAGGGSGLHFFCAVFAAGGGFVSTFVLYRKDKTRAARTACFSSLFELSTMTCAVFATLWSQCAILPPTCTYNENPSAYDVFHGNWHVLLSMLTGYVYLRAAQLQHIIEHHCDQERPPARATKGLDTDRVGRAELWSLAHLFCYCSAIIVCRLSSLHSDTTTHLLGALSLLFVFDAISTFFRASRPATISFSRDCAGQRPLVALDT